jgi:hypothetical protein
MVDISPEFVGKCHVCGISGVKLWRETTGLYGRTTRSAKLFCKKHALEHPEAKLKFTPGEFVYIPKRCIGKLVPYIPGTTSRFVIVDLIDSSEGYKEWLELK